MPAILVVETEQFLVQRITTALGASWKVCGVSSVPEALEFTASEAPLLFVVSTEVEGAIGLLEPFARRRGGPGTVAIVPSATSSGVGLHADEVVVTPFTDEALRAAIERTLRGGPRRAVNNPADDSRKLTSQDIFGDLVADLDDAVQSVAPPSTQPQRPPRSSADARIDRKLEETLSGILGITATSKAPAPPPAATEPPQLPRRGSGRDVDALLSQTLSGLDLPVGRKPVPTPVPSSPAATPRRPAELDFSLLDELTRGGSRKLRPAPTTPPTPPPPVPSKPQAPAPTTPEVPGGFEAWDLTPPGLKPSGVPSPTPPILAAEPAPVPLPPPEPEPAPVVPEPVRPQIAAGQRFGQYLLLEKIGIGGMAEVWKARSQGVEGFQKTVAIKRILPHLTDSADFVTMFVDEAKLAAQLNHDNIIQIFDLGKIGDDYYMAMEYVEGENLRAILNKARDRGEPLPAAIALMVAVRLAGALGYAHHKRDFDGQELGLVHRDVSPQNVLVSYEGNVKLCDFGIVKAVARTGHTQMGALKGKLQYMSPEQAWGRPVDQRSDLFSVGVLLFEMLTGRRMFTGETEMQLLEAVRDCRIQAPSEVNPEIPVAVDVVVAKALARDPADRYQAADELILALQSLLARLTTQPAVRDVAAYMRALFRGGADPELPHFPPEPEPSFGFMPPLAAASSVAPAAVPFSTMAFPAVTEIEAPELLPAFDLEPSIETPTEAAPEPDPEEHAGFEVEPLASYLPEPEPLLPPVAEPPPPVREFHATIALPVPPRLAEVSAAPVRPAPSEVVEVEPLAPLPGVAVEESSSGRGWLLATIIAALVLGGLAAWYFTRKPQPPAGPELSPPAIEDSQDGAATTPENGETFSEPDSAPTEPSAPSSLAPSDLDLARAVDEKSAVKEEELRRQFEAERKRLQEKIEEASRGAPAGSPPATAPAAAPPAAAPPVQEEPPPTVDTAPETPPPLPDPTPVPSPSPPPSQPSTGPTASPPPTPAAPTTKLGELVSMGPNVTPPQLVSFTKPQYPPLARKLRVTGEVIISVLVDENGAAREVRLQKGVSQNVGLNEAALEAARTARYRPPTKEGVRVRMWTTLKIPFQL